MPTIAETLLARADDPRAGLHFEERTWAWRQVVDEARMRSAALGDLLAPDRPPHVGVLLDNVPEFVFTLGGAALAGATVVGVNPTRRGAELEHDIRHTDCQVVLTDAEHLPLLDGLDVGRIVLVDGSEWASLLTACVTETAPAAEDRLYLLIFTSGSTGAPKAVRMSQGRAARTAAASGAVFGPGDVLYCSMPLFHGNALLANLFPGMGKGASIALRRKFSATGFLPDVRRYGCTFFNYVGRALSYIVATEEQPDDADNPLKWGLGSEASRRDMAEFTRRFGCFIFEGYGSSENAVIIQPGPGMPPAAMGQPKEGQDVAIVDPATGTECPPARFDADGRLLNAGDATGEIVGRNVASTFEGYYANSDADAERVRGGWYWSGDLGFRDADGWIYFAGRAADWLRVDGENFASAPVERILSRYPGFDGVAVYAVPDPVTADQVMAAVELSAPFDTAAFERFLADQPDLGTKWAPRFVRVVERLPVTGTNKVDKQPLRLARWATDDPVWWRPAAGEPYRELTDTDRADLTRRFADNARGALLS